jgi:hypothetical protein
MSKTRSTIRDDLADCAPDDSRVAHCSLNEPTKVLADVIFPGMRAGRVQFPIVGCGTEDCTLGEGVVEQRCVLVKTGHGSDADAGNLAMIPEIEYPRDP